MYVVFFYDKSKDDFRALCAVKSYEEGMVQLDTYAVAVMAQRSDQDPQDVDISKLDTPPDTGYALVADQRTEYLNRYGDSERLNLCHDGEIEVIFTFAKVNGSIDDYVKDTDTPLTAAVLNQVSTTHA